MIGKVLGGRYELLEKIGVGGMAVVYRAKCLLLNRTVAIKILRDDLDSSDEFLKRFNIEAQSAAALTNQHIVSIYDVGKDGDINYIVMECVDGITLKEYIKENEKVEWEQAVKFTMGIADALAEAHKKHIIHRDIKPQNIIVTNDGNVKVTDFGIARMSSGATISASGDVLGSVHYLSPEQARGGYVDERSDIYSLGVVMYEMLTGRVPFDGDTPVAVAMKQIEQAPTPPEEIVDSVPKSVSAIVLKAMCKETSGRYATVTELYDDLSKVLSNPSMVVVEEKDEEIPEDATRKIPAIKIDQVVPNKETMIEEKANKNSKQKMSKTDKKTVVSAVITSLVIVILLSLFAASAIFPQFKPFAFLAGSNGSTEKIPNLISKTVEEAEKLLEGTDFTLNIKERIEDSDAEPGTIIKQYPKAGREVKGSRSIDVTIVKESNGYKLEDYTNKNFESVQKKLEKNGLNVEIERQHSEDIAVDYIISQSPSKNSSLQKGDTVTLYVSDGVDDGEITVPNLIGMKKNDAKRRIEQENLSVGTYEYKNSDKAKDTVIGQSINPGDPAKEKDVINLVLSNGEGGGEEEPGNTVSNSSGNQVKKQVLTYYLPTDKDEVKVKLTANGSTIYEGIVNPNKNPVFERTVEGAEGTVYEFYVDGVKLGN